MESELAVDEILAHLEHIHELPYQLIIVAGEHGAGKTGVLKELSARVGYPLVNVNLQLSGRLLELTQSQRAVRADQLLTDIVAEAGSGPVILDNTELLFDQSLKVSPLALLKKISRNRPVVSSWNGAIEDRHLNYAGQGHTEYGRYETDDIIVIDMAKPA